MNSAIQPSGEGADRDPQPAASLCGCVFRPASQTRPSSGSAVRDRLNNVASSPPSNVFHSQEYFCPPCLRDKLYPLLNVQTDFVNGSRNPDPKLKILQST